MEEERPDSAPEIELAHASAFGWDVFFWAACIMGGICALGTLGASSSSERIAVGAIAVVCCVVAIVAKRKAAHLPQYPAGRCGACGYDLRATPERCPECGATLSDYYGSVPKAASLRAARVMLVICVCAAVVAIAVAWEGPAIPALRFAAVMVALVSAIGAVAAYLRMFPQR